MANILTSCDLNEGQSDLHSCKLVAHGEANNSIAYTSWLLASRRFVLQLKFDKVNIQMVAVTLKYVSRSYDWYGTKVMLGRIIKDIEKDHVVKSL